MENLMNVAEETMETAAEMVEEIPVEVFAEPELVEGAVDAGLSFGKKAGIVAGAVALGGALVYGIVKLVKKNKKAKTYATVNEEATDVEEPVEAEEN